MSDIPAPSAAPSLDAAPIRRAAADTLTWGFRVTVAILAIGLVVTLAQGQDLETTATDFEDVIPGLLDGEGSAIVSLAILAMMITPVITVIVTALGFFRIGDRRYGRISLIVLGVLGISIIASFFR
jgi:uncharacterized membrane protein